MLTLVIGRAGAGKSEYLYRQAALRSRQGARGAIFLVPETCSHQAERELCALGGDSISLSCEVLTFRRLANRVFSLYGGLAEQTLDEPGRILVMHQAMENAAAQLRYYRTGAKEEILSSLCRLRDELKSCSVAPEALAAAAEGLDGTLQAKLGDISLIYACYDSLCEGAQMDERDILSLCAAKLTGSGFFDGRDVYLDGYSGFTPQQLDILKNLSGANVYAAFTVDSLDDPEPVFAKPAQAAARLMTLISHGHAQVVRLDPPQRAAGLAMLESSLFRFSADTCPGSGDEVQFHFAQDLYSECEYIAAKIIELMRSGVRAKEISVAAGDFESYRLPLTAALEKCSLPYYISENAKLSAKSAAAVLMNALDIACSGFKHTSVFSYLKTGLTGFTQEQCSLLENYCILWKIRPRQWLQEAPWTMHPGGFGAEFDEDSNEKLALINRLRDEVRAPLSALSRALNSEGIALDKLRALYDFMEAIGLEGAIAQRAEALRAQSMQEGAQYAQIWSIIIGCIDQFAEIAGQRVLDARQFGKIMQLMLESCEIGSIPPSIDRISVGPASAAAQLDAPYLFLAGA